MKRIILILNLLVPILAFGSDKSSGPNCISMSQPSSSDSKPSTSDRLLRLAKLGFTDDLKKELENKNSSHNINLQDENGQTALHWAVRSRNERMVRLLIAHGIDINSADKNKATALSYALNNNIIILLKNWMLLSKEYYEKNAKNISFKDWVKFTHPNMLNDFERLYILENTLVLFNAVKNGDYEEVQKLLPWGGHSRSKIDIEARDSNGNTPLLLTVGINHSYEEIAEWLMERVDANPNAQNNDGWTALMMAAQFGYKKLAKLLMRYKADINIKNKFGDTAQTLDKDKIFEQISNEEALVNAAKDGKLKEVERIVKNYKVDINDFSKCVISCCVLDLNALMAASSRGHIEIVKFLLNESADVNAKNSENETAIIYAARNGHYDTVKCLLNKGAKVDIDGKHKAVMSAAYNCHGNIVRLLLKRGGGVDVNDRSHALIELVIKCKKSLLDLLIKNGVNVDVQKGNGRTALWYAPRYATLEIAESLIKSGCNINTQDDWGSTPLSEAISRGRKEIFALLIRNNANIAPITDFRQTDDENLNQLLIKWRDVTTDFNRDKNDQFSKFKIAIDKQPDLIDQNLKKIFEVLNKYLIFDLSKIIAIDYLGGVSFKNWTEFHNPDLIQDYNNLKKPKNQNSGSLHFLSSYGNEIHKALLNAVKSENLNEINRILQNNDIDINRFVKIAEILIEEFNALMIAASSGKIEAVKLLLNKGADINAENGYRKTALHHAINGGHTNIVRLLLEKGINIHDAVLTACGNTEIMELLIEHGANFNIKNGHSGYTPLMVAAESGYENCMGLLIQKGADINAKDHFNKTALNKAKNDDIKQILTIWAPVSESYYNYKRFIAPDKFKLAISKEPKLMSDKFKKIFAVLNQFLLNDLSKITLIDYFIDNVSFEDWVRVYKQDMVEDFEILLQDDSK